MQHLPSDIYQYITYYLPPKSIITLLTTSKEITNKFNSKVLLQIIDRYKNDENYKYKNFITDHIVTIIAKDVNVVNMNCKNYTHSIFDAILLLRCILEYNVDKTILMLKFIGNQHVYMPNTITIKYFRNEQKKLHFCLNKTADIRFMNDQATTNLHFVYAIFFTPIEFMKQIIPHILINNKCEFKSVHVYGNHMRMCKYVDNNWDVFNVIISLRYALQHLYDGNERIEFLNTMPNESNNFKIDKIHFDAKMDK